MNNSVPFFSIVIPTYNHAQLIGRCIDSLLKQTYQNWEAIIVNNFSEDNTIEVIEAYNDYRIRLINNSNDGVIAVSRNKGLSEAKGDWICFLDSDDWWYPNKLEASLQYLECYDLIYHDLDIYTSVHKTNSVAKGRTLRGDIAKDLIINGNGIVNSSVVIKKEVIELVGEITVNENLIMVEDYDYWIRVAKVTNRFKYIDQSLGGYWVGENISYTVKQIERARYLLDKYIQDLSLHEQKSAISLYHFNSARMYHYLSMFDKASDCYIESLRTNKFKRVLKAIGGYLMCRFKIK